MKTHCEVRPHFMAPKLLIDLPADVVQHIVVRLTLAHHIARAAPTWRIAYHGLAP